MSSDRKDLPPSPAEGDAAPVRAVVEHRARGFVDSDAALRALLQRAADLVEDGVKPRLPVEAYLDALLQVLAFIYARPALFQAANLGREVCGAVERITQELQSIPEEPLPILPPASVAQKEAVHTGALLLSAYRDAIRRVARGPKGLAARAEFGVGETLDAGDGTQVCMGIARFLSAAQRYPDYLDDAGLSAQQLLGLAAQERVLRGYDAQRQQLAVAPQQAHRLLVLHAALEYFFDRFSAALCAHLFDHPEERLRGLRLVPRAERRRQPVRRAGDFAFCHVTDSGRLIF